MIGRGDNEVPTRTVTQLVGIEPSGVLTSSASLSRGAIRPKRKLHLLGWLTNAQTSALEVKCQFALRLEFRLDRETFSSNVTDR